MPRSLWSAKGFEKIDRPDRIRVLLNRAAGESARAVLWFTRENQTEPLRLRVEEVKKSSGMVHLELVPDEVGQDLLAWVKDRAGSPCRVGIFKKNAGVLSFDTQFIGGSAQSVMITLPEEMHSLERRKTTRLEISKAYELHLILPPSRPYLIADLSEEGISFFAPRTEADVFLPETVLRNTQFQVRQSLIRATMLVKNVRVEKGRNPRLRVGAVFQKIADQDRDFIANYILEFLAQFPGSDVVVKTSKR